MPQTERSSDASALGSIASETSYSQDDLQYEPRFPEEHARDGFCLDLVDHTMGEPPAPPDRTIDRKDSEESTISLSPRTTVRETRLTDGQQRDSPDQPRPSGE
ncbi:MAG: hypothetical protein MMC23_002788, partial [Stictis urceolatum]|nr:hypothetical protein [Stictis urceolata]